MGQETFEQWISEAPQLKHLDRESEACNCKFLAALGSGGRCRKAVLGVWPDCKHIIQNYTLYPFTCCSTLYPCTRCSCSLHGVTSPSSPRETRCSLSMLKSNLKIVFFLTQCRPARFPPLDLLFCSRCP